MDSKLAITRCFSYSQKEVYDSLRESIELLGGIRSFVKKGDNVLIKPNLLSGNSPEKAVTTHPQVIWAIIKLVKEAGGIPRVGDSPGIGSLEKVTKKTGVKQILEEMQVPLAEFNRTVEVENRTGHIFKQFEIAKAVMEADLVINVPKLKTHGQMLLSLAVKNIFGCIVGTNKAKWHLKAGINRLFFAQMLLDLYLAINPGLTVVDGIIGMEGEGPSKGTPREIGLIISGSNCVAIDVVIGEILGINKEDLPTTKAAMIRGLPGIDLQAIDIRGEKLEKIKVKNFILSSVHHVGWNLPGFLSSFILDLISSKPSIDLKKCVSCGACIESCPPRTMELLNEKVVIDYKKCIRCYCCHELCPQGAVKIEPSLVRKLNPFSNH